MATKKDGAFLINFLLVLISITLTLGVAELTLRAIDFPEKKYMLYMAG